MFDTFSSLSHNKGKGVDKKLTRTLRQLSNIILYRSVFPGLLFIPFDTFSLSKRYIMIFPISYFIPKSLCVINISHNSIRILD